MCAGRSKGGSEGDAVGIGIDSTMDSATSRDQCGPHGRAPRPAKASHSILTWVVPPNLSRTNRVLSAMYADGSQGDPRVIAVGIGIDWTMESATSRDLIGDPWSGSAIPKASHSILTRVGSPNLSRSKRAPSAMCADGSGDRSGGATGGDGIDPTMDEDRSGMGWESIPDGIVDPSPRDSLPIAMIDNPRAMGLSIHRVDTRIPSPWDCGPTTMGSSINRVGVESRRDVIRSP
jgi:hypothetical protein